MEKKRVLITYATYGSGHKTVANYIYDYLKKHSDYEIKIIDLMDYENIVASCTRGKNASRFTCGMKKDNDRGYLREVILHNRDCLREQVRMLKEIKPLIEIKVININAYMEKPEYKAADALYKTLLDDKSSILSVLPRLETYKTMNQRYASIPNEIKIIDNDLKRLEKTVSVCDRVDTLESLKYLKLILY